MRLRRGEGPPIRLLTAVPICDGHDSAINTLNLEFIRHGIEVIYLGYHRSARDIVRAAIQEDARAIGISSYNGGHLEFFAEVLARLKQQGASSIGVFGGGGGTITPDDAARMKGRGVDEIFFAGTPLPRMVEWVKRTYRSPARSRARGASPDRQLARLLSSVESGRRLNFLALSPSKPPPLAERSRERGWRGRGPHHQSQITNRKSPIQVLALSPLHPPLGELSGRGGRLGGGRGQNTITIGITGPGGAGKTTLIDELVLRFLKAHPDGRLAILSHDPSVLGHGALLGDRASMIYSQDDRVFMRSLATRGRAGGLSAATETCLRVLKQSAFDLVLVETVGIGQEALPFGRSLRRPLPLQTSPSRGAVEGEGVEGERAKYLVDKTVLVMSPDYGSRLQLQKIVMLDRADLVVVNKSDLPGARTAMVEIEQRLSSNSGTAPPACEPGAQAGRTMPQKRLLSTTAKRHRDAGVDALFQELMS